MQKKTQSVLVNLIREQRGSVFKQLCIQCGITTAQNGQKYFSTFQPKGLTLLTKALRSKRQKVYLSILGSCYTTLDAKLF